MAISGDRKTLKGLEPQEGEALAPGSPKRKTLKERRPREVQSRGAGETVWRMRRIEPGSTFRGRPKPKMEADRRKTVRVQVVTKVRRG
jgi:hypothetical protein